MAKKKPFKALKKKDLEVLLGHHIETSVGFHNSELSKERSQVLDYYNAKKPEPFHKGSSKYVSPDVYNSVESMKSELLETFSAGNRIVTFDPRRPEAAEASRVRTAYADYVVFGQNDGYSIFSDAIMDGLMARMGVAKVWWDKVTEEVEEEFQDLSIEEADGLLMDDKVEPGEVEVDAETGLASGTITRKIDKSQIRIEMVAPEEFLVTTNAKKLRDAPFCAHRTAKTISDLLKMGFTAEMLDKISTEGDQELSMSEESITRNEDVGSSRLQWDDSGQKQSQKVIYYECYIEVDMKGDGINRLYKCSYAGGKLLEDPVEVSHRPFVTFVPLPVAHRLHGSNFAAKIIPIQNARTTLTRSILDHTLITNNPRYMVVKGALSNPREMLENRLGGLVNVNRPDGLIPLPQNPLNPYVYQTIGLMDTDKENLTGISGLSQGLNKDAISKQNSEGMVEQLVSMSQKRQKIIARNFANQFVKDLYLLVDRLAQANESERKVIKVSGGKFLEVDPSNWDGEVDATVELKLGYGEMEREAKKLMGLHVTLAQDPSVAPMYQLANKHKLLNDAFEKGGMIGAANYLTPPEEVPPPEPDPLAMKELEIKEMLAQAQTKQAEVAEMKVHMNAKLEEMMIQMKAMKDQMDAAQKKAELDLDTFEVHERVAQQKEELDLAEKQSDEATKAIISPSY